MTVSATAAHVEKPDAWIDRGETVFVTRGGYDLDLSWRGRTLTVVCQECDRRRVELQLSRWRDVEVEYPEFGSSEVRSALARHAEVFHPFRVFRPERA
jgi:hypothetical protein